MAISPHTKLSELINTKVAYIQKLNKMGLETLQDLLLYYPRDYEDLSHTKRIWELTPGEIVTLKGWIHSFKSIRTPRGKWVQNLVFMDDMQGQLPISFFNQSYLTTKFPAGSEIYLSGKVVLDKVGKMTLQSPQIEAAGASQTHTGRIVAIYPESEYIHSKWLREKIAPLLSYTHVLPNPIPQEIEEQLGLIDKQSAIQNIHAPKDEHLLDAARNRIAFEELFVIQTRALMRKWVFQHSGQADTIVAGKKTLIHEAKQNLPFTLTQSQEDALSAILQDIAKDTPMSRLLEGDVGSGKTIVAFLATLAARDAGLQVAILAPTEVLARQHFANAQDFFQNSQDPFDQSLQLLIGSQSAKQKTAIKDMLARGEAKLVVGTHALIQEDVVFKNLGLVIIDEQHRFGVMQRGSLKRHGTPHILSMTATPIPRSLALTIFGEYDITVLSDKPAGRKEIITRYVPESKRIPSYEFCMSEIRKGHQVFVICPLIEESEKMDELASVQTVYEQMLHAIPDARIEYLHGKMPAQDKEHIMQRFKDKEFDILVSTSVIEVGVDIPNASIIMIEGADRFGLSQLHQFRGRVGRSHIQSYCFLFGSRPDLGMESKKRIKAMIDTNDGFELSQIDLKQRGPGSVYGVRQSGVPDVHMASLSDTRLIETARNAASQVLQ